MTDLSTCPNLLFTIGDGVARITLNRPERMNAFTFEMIDAWAAALQHCRTDDTVKVVVVTGAGKAFCSGGDIVEMCDRVEQTPEQRKNEIFQRVQRIPLALEDLDKPVIAVVNGVATGAGLDLALMCDMRFAAASARFAETYLKVGLVPGAGGTHFLPRLVGTAKALEMFFTAEFVESVDAVALGVGSAQEQHHVHVVLQRRQHDLGVAQVGVAQAGQVDDADAAQVLVRERGKDLHPADRAERVDLVPGLVVLGDKAADLVGRHPAQRGSDQRPVVGEGPVVGAQVPIGALRLNDQGRGAGFHGDQ